jgi:hypothetical protein
LFNLFKKVIQNIYIINIVYSFINSKFEIIYPFEASEGHPKFAISRRNKSIVESADVIVCCVEKDYGGAYNAYKYAQKKEKTIINLLDFV